MHTHTQGVHGVRSDGLRHKAYRTPLPDLVRKHGHPPLPLRRRPCLRTSTPLLRYSFSVRGSWFPLDLLSTFPFDRVVFATTGNSVASGFVRLVKVLRVSRLLKVINKSQTLRFSASVRIAASVGSPVCAHAAFSSDHVMCEALHSAHTAESERSGSEASPPPAALAAPLVATEESGAHVGS